MRLIKTLLWACAAVAAVGTASAQTKWDLAAAYPATNFHTENLTAFAADVDKATAGKLKITVHANASLFKAPEIKRAVQGGQAQAGEILLVNYQNEWQLFGADGLPFLADSYDEAMKLYKAQRPLLEKKLGEQGMLLLYAVAWPPQGIYSKKPIASAADLKGSKWRAYSPATARIAELVGAQPVTVQAAELSQAMATGVVESYMSSGSTGFDTKTYEHLKYWYDTQAWLPKNALHRQQGGLRRARCADQGGRAEGRRRRRGARLGGEQTRQHRIDRQAEGQRHEHRCPVGAAQGRHEEGRRHDADRVARQGRRPTARPWSTRSASRAHTQPCAAPSMPCTTVRRRWRRCSWCCCWWRCWPRCSGASSAFQRPPAPMPMPAT